MWVAGVALTMASAFLPLAAEAVPRVVAGDLPAPMTDGRMLGHLPYPEAPPADLIAAPAGFAIGPSCAIQRDVAPDLTRMLAAAAAAPGVGKSLRGVSCFRTIAHQRGVFCRWATRGACRDPAGRARFVGPPGYSEHATGYAIDFAVRPSPGCPDVNPCLATTPAGRWLLQHATEFGFELSFPAGNAQGVAWEPWHWRWVGATIDVPGAARARLGLARARTNYPANPGIADVADAWLPALMSPPVPSTPIIALPAPAFPPGPLAPRGH